MYAKRRIGSITVSCGTPEEIGIVMELVPLVINDCFLFSKKSFTHLWVSP